MFCFPISDQDCSLRGHPAFSGLVSPAEKNLIFGNLRRERNDDRKYVCGSQANQEMVPRKFFSFKCRPTKVQPRMKRQKINSLGPVHARLISANPGLKFYSIVCILPSRVLLRLTFWVIITVSWSKGSTVFCNWARVACSKARKSRLKIGLILG